MTVFYRSSLLTNEDVSFARAAGGADKPFLFHLLNESCGTVIAYTETALQITGGCSALA
jgi:hypothetical protein